MAPHGTRERRAYQTASESERAWRARGGGWSGIRLRNGGKKKILLLRKVSHSNSECVVLATSMHF